MLLAIALHTFDGALSLAVQVAKWDRQTLGGSLDQAGADDDRIACEEAGLPHRLYREVAPWLGLADF